MNPGTFYLYEYENYKRSRNVGFIKVSRYYQSCILQIQARGIPVRAGGRLNLYAFSCGQDQMTFSQIADLTSGGRNVSARLTVSETHFPGQRSLQEIDGFFLRLPEDIREVFWMASSFFFDVNPDMMQPSRPKPETPDPEEPVPPETEESVLPEIEPPVPPEAEEPVPSTTEIPVSPETEEPVLESAEIKDLPRVKKISREDLTLLPQRFWPLANNSFLLHAFHNYHHLALIEENGRRWLGVPGIYDTREARAADLFGFPRFTRAYVPVLDLSGEERNDAADFGHWCRCVGSI